MDTNEVKLSWYDKNVLPRTKEYKDFVNELKNTPIERFYRDGERQFSEKEQKYLAIYQERQKVTTNLEYTQEDKESILSNLDKEDPLALEDVPKVLLNDKSFVLKAIDLIYEINISPISSELKDDEEIILEAVEQNEYNLNFASDRIKDNKEVILKVVGLDGDLLEFASDRLKNDKEVVIQAILSDVDSQYPKGLEFASDKIKNELSRLNLQELKESLEEIKTKNQNNMAQGEFNQQEYLENQVKYLGFGESQEIKDQIKKGIEGAEKEFHIHTTSDKVMNGNKADFTLNFKKGDKGGVFLNSYDATLTTKKGEERTHSFPVNRSNNITAKEAINLLEGRAVKTELTNKETGEISPAFIKLKLKEDKNQYGNYQMECYNKNYGVDTAQIMDKSNLKLNDDIQRERTQKSLEKGNITKVTFKDGNNGFAILNPQYKMLNLYDEKMNRINTNKEAPKVEIQDNQKNNVREQSQRRSL